MQLILKDGLFFLPLITKYKQALATLVELDENEEEELKEDQEASRMSGRDEVCYTVR